MSCVCSQVDERCVRAAADTHSNLFELDRQLLRFVAVPWSHVHAMPVDVAGRLCDPELQGRPASLASLGLRASLASLGPRASLASLDLRASLASLDLRASLALLDL